MAVATEQLALFLLTAEGLVHCRAADGFDEVAVVGTDLDGENIRTVIIAAGYRPDHPWMRVPVLALDGSIRQQRGVTPAPGLYVVGQYFQHRRDSGFIDGARHDARDVVDHLLGRRAPDRRFAATRRSVA